VSKAVASQLKATSLVPPHESAVAHVTGRALFIDDLPEPDGLLHLAFGTSSLAHARVTNIDLEKVRSAPGVVGVFSSCDVPGENNVAPVSGEDPLFQDGCVTHVGQSLFAVAATTRRAARRAAKLAVITYEQLPALVSIEQARNAGSVIEPTQSISRGDVSAAFREAPYRLSGSITIGGQEHFYLEGQVAMALPGEGREIRVISSTQHPSEVQATVATVLGLERADVTVETRRIGGGFGGKETQAAIFAAAAALAAQKLRRPVKCRADRMDDIAMTGKRHDFLIDYDVGYDESGRIHGLVIEMASRCGDTVDLSPAINDRAMLHVDNCYYLDAVEIISHRFRTHTVSNTAFRGFGAPQGMMAIERVMDHIARALCLDPLIVRQRNLYGSNGRDKTPYGMIVSDNIAPKLIDKLVASSNYKKRRDAIDQLNSTSTRIKHGIALTPVKFGISFTTTHLNQGGALLQVYADGTILLNHGGVEMGQGLFTKVAQIVANCFGVPCSSVRSSATCTDKVPNTSATAASSGTDLNGMAALVAAQKIRGRLTKFLALKKRCEEDKINFIDGQVIVDDESISFAECCQIAYLSRISLSATGFYSTPKIAYDRSVRKGRPFLYFAYGAAVSEVALDTCTGEHRLLRVDILHDVGCSINTAIDRGQIEGAFTQGVGWLTSEELFFDEHGHLLTLGPSTYKIPTANSVAEQLNLEIWHGEGNKEPTVMRSKAVGEPPFMLAISVFSALAAAVSAASNERSKLTLDAPATPERLRRALKPSGD